MAEVDAATGVQVHMAFPDGERSVVDAAAPELTFGRRVPEDGGSVQVMDRLASRRHAKAKLLDHGIMLEDLNSANGTLVGGQPIKQPVSIAYGQPFQIGETTLRIVRPSDHSAETSDIPLDEVRGCARIAAGSRRANRRSHGGVCWVSRKTWPGHAGSGRFGFVPEVVTLAREQLTPPACAF